MFKLEVKFRQALLLPSLLGRQLRLCEKVIYRTIVHLDYELGA